MNYLKSCRNLAIAQSQGYETVAIARLSRLGHKLALVEAKCKEMETVVHLMASRIQDRVLLCDYQVVQNAYMQCEQDCMQKQQSYQKKIAQSEALQNSLNEQQHVMQQLETSIQQQRQDNEQSQLELKKSVKVQAQLQQQHAQIASSTEKVSSQIRDHEEAVATLKNSISNTASIYQTQANATQAIKQDVNTLKNDLQKQKILLSSLTHQRDALLAVIDENYKKQSMFGLSAVAKQVESFTECELQKQQMLKKSILEDEDVRRQIAQLRAGIADREKAIKYYRMLISGNKAK